MDLSFTYTKVRKDFGRQPMFCEGPVYLLDSINPDVTEQRKYCLRNPVHQEVQATTSKSENEVNTKRITYQDRGVDHAEGGWPKDVSFNDEEVTARYRRRVERDDSYVDAVLDLYPKLQHYIDQNNAIEMYEMFFKDLPYEEPVEKPSCRLNGTYKDPYNRPISCMSWTYEYDCKVAISYCNRNYPVVRSNNTTLVCYIWDLENPNNPCYEFDPPTACWQIACSPIHPSGIIGGLDDGRVCIFDLRAQKDAVEISPMHLAHRDPVSSLLFMLSRLNTDFFTGSTDGICKWWDVRNLSSPTDTLIMSVRIPPGEKSSLANSESVSALQYGRASPTIFFSLHPLLKIKAHEDGRVIALGDTKGAMYMVFLSENLVLPGERDRQLMSQTYDRETRREHILETRIKEIRLKLKVEEGAVTAAPPEIEEEESIRIAKDEYRRILAEEMRLAGVVPTLPTSVRGDSMRMR